MPRMLLGRHDLLVMTQPPLFTHSLPRAGERYTNPAREQDLNDDGRRPAMQNDKATHSPKRPSTVDASVVTWRQWCCPCITGCGPPGSSAAPCRKRRSTIELQRDAMAAVLVGA
jgi:hypothetical protein